MKPRHLLLAVAVSLLGGFGAVSVFLNGALLFVTADCPGPKGQPCGNGDVNADGTLNLADAVYLLQHLFADGPAPVALADSPELVTRVEMLEGELNNVKTSIEELSSRSPRKLAVLYPDGKLRRADGTTQDVSGSPTSGIQELIDHANQNFVDAYIIGGVEDGTRGFQKYGAVVYNVNETIVFPPIQGYRLDTGSITININAGANSGIKIDSCMMVDLRIRGQIVYHGTGVALDFNPTDLLPLDTFVGPVIVDSCFHITTVVPTNDNATAVRFTGPINHSTFFFNEINNGRFGIDVTGSFFLNRVICKHVHGQSGSTAAGIRVNTTSGRNVWEVNIVGDGQGLSTAIATQGSSSLWTVNIVGSISTGVRIGANVRNTRFFLLSNDAATPVVDNANHASNKFY